MTGLDWAEELRRDRAADTRARGEAEAVLIRARAEADVRRLQAEAEQRRADERMRRSAQVQADRARREAAERRRARREAARARVRAWLHQHLVEVLVYPLAAVSLAMAAPAMAAYGQRVYADTLGGALGVLLPVITELGMWCFAVAVHVARRRGRPIWALRTGLVLFCAAAATANALHGLETGAAAAAVMGMVSVAGVVAHQLAVATPLRSREERARARLERRARRRLLAARRAAISQAAVQVDASGRARLVIQPGRYVLRHGRLTPADPGDGPPEDETGDQSDALDRELAALLDGVTETGPETAAETGPETAAETGPETAAETGPETAAETGPDIKGPGESRRRQRSRRRSGGRRERPFAELREEFLNLLLDNPEAASWSASRIAKSLRCAKGRALILRDEMQRGVA